MAKEGAFWVDIRRVEAQVESLESLIPKKQRRGMGRRKLIRLEQQVKDTLHQEKTEAHHGHEELDAQKPDAQHVYEPKAQRIIDDNLVLFMTPTALSHRGYEELDAQKSDAQHIHEPEAQRIIDNNLMLFTTPTTPPPARETFHIKLRKEGKIPNHCTW